MSTIKTPTRRIRTRAAINDNVSEDTTKTKVVLEEDGNTAEVIENIGGKQVRYEARVKEIEDTENDNEFSEASAFGEDDYERLPNNDFQEYKENPKSGLDRAFDDITYFVTVENVVDHFYAKVARLPDGIGENWNIPARDRFELGVVTFTHKDRFAFIPELQKINHNSGGKLAIDIYDSDHKPLMIQRMRHHTPSQICFQVTIPNPPPQPIESNGNQPSSLDKMLEAILKSNQETMQFIRDSQNRPREKSTLEAAIEQKVLNDILNPPENKSADSFQQVMTQMMLLPTMVQKMSERMFPDPPTPAEPTTFDRIMQLVETPVVQNVANRAMEVINAAAENRMLISQKQAGIPLENDDDNEDIPDTIYQEQPQPTQRNMQAELIQLIVNELESDRELNASNPTIQHLQAEYPTQVNFLKMACKGGSFTDVFKMLLEQTATIQPYPFAPYLDIEQSQLKQDYVLNEAGDRIKDRLLAFYNYVKTT